MGTTTLVSGECVLSKNGAFVGKSASTLAYDHDLGFFKMINAGNIWMSFRANQVVGSQVSITGALLKRNHVTILVKYPTGDEFSMDFVAQNEGESTTAKTWIDNLARIGQATVEVQGVLKVREKVPMSEVAAVLARRGMPHSTQDSVRAVEGLIASGAIDGVMEGDMFVSRLAKQRETVNYQVVTSFDVAKNGVISLKCPSCGSAVQMRDASNTRKCDYCKTEFMVPKRILDLM